jgi:hypothetical protein
VATATLAQTVRVHQTFTLRLIWDKPNHQFFFGLDNHPDVALIYPAADVNEAALPFANIEISHTVANCVAGAVTIDSTVEVGLVGSNDEAVIP